MDPKRQRRPQNAATAAARPRPTAVEALRYAAEAKAPDRPPKLGEILVAQGQITPEQLATALKSQRTSGRRLGEELIQAGYVKRSVVSRALRIQRRITFAAMCSTLAVSTVAPAVEAAQQHGQIAVSAFVPAQAVGEVVQQPVQITITDADIARGYVDVAAGSQLRVTSNNPSGYVIDFFTRLPIFRSVRVSNSSGSADLGPDGGTIIERGQVGRNLPLALTYRFQLAESVQPGTYAWPLALNIRPL
ncbi:MAG TPA: hypothetical protein VL742_11535 [Casimicrobiaceae bacterium]|nr:hypothetical protein [Casimicrobiaceae bacterium]